MRQKMLTMVENFFRLWNPNASEIDDPSYGGAILEYQRHYNRFMDL